MKVPLPGEPSLVLAGYVRMTVVGRGLSLSRARRKGRSRRGVEGASKGRKWAMER